MAVAGIIRQQACGLGVWCPRGGGGSGGPPWGRVLTHRGGEASLCPQLDRPGLLGPRQSGLSPASTAAY